MNGHEMYRQTSSPKREGKEKVKKAGEESGLVSGFNQQNSRMGHVLSTTMIIYLSPIPLSIQCNA